VAKPQINKKSSKTANSRKITSKNSFSLRKWKNTSFAFFIFEKKKLAEKRRKGKEAKKS
jgi:hypothetical protein